MRLLTALVLFMLMVAGGNSWAHTRSESHSVIEINGTGVDIVTTISEPDLARIGAQGGRISDAAVGHYLADRFRPLAGDEPCALVPPVVPLAAAPGFRRYDLTFVCRTSRDLRIQDAALFDLIAGHVDFVQIQNVETGDFTEELITADRQTFEIGGEAEQLKQAGLFDFVRLGVLHILTGVDHMSFLLGLMLISRRPRDLVFVITGFTLGHSLTLGLAVTGVVRPRAEFIDALVALTIVLIGAENISEATRRPYVVAAVMAIAMGAMLSLRLFGFGELPPFLVFGAALFSSSYLLMCGTAKDPGRLRLVMTMAFGLVHGFGFASDLLTMQLPRERLIALLGGFNVGVEIGQLTLVVGVAAIVLVAARIGLALPRRLVVDVGSSALVAIGTYWLVARSFV